MLENEWAARLDVESAEVELEMGPDQKRKRRSRSEGWQVERTVAVMSSVMGFWEARPSLSLSHGHKSAEGRV